MISSKLPLDGQMAIVSCFRNSSIILESFLDYQTSTQYIKKALVIGRRLASNSDPQYLEMMEDLIGLEKKSAALMRSDLDDVIL
jgi:hypothetical protein